MFFFHISMQMADNFQLSLHHSVTKSPNGIRNCHILVPLWHFWNVVSLLKSVHVQGNALGVILWAKYFGGDGYWSHPGELRICSKWQLHSTLTISPQFARYLHWQVYVDILRKPSLTDATPPPPQKKKKKKTHQGEFVQYWPALMVSKSLGLWATIRWTSALRPTPGGPTSTCNHWDISFSLKGIVGVSNIQCYCINESIGSDGWWLWPGFCGRMGEPSRRARTAASRRRPPRRSSWRCNQTSSSPSSARTDIEICVMLRTKIAGSCQKGISHKVYVTSEIPNISWSILGKYEVCSRLSKLVFIKMFDNVWRFL